MDLLNSGGRRHARQLLLSKPRPEGSFFHFRAQCPCASRKLEPTDIGRIRNSRCTGIILSDSVKEKPHEGEVIAVGPGRVTDDGKRQSVDVKEGDRVLFAKYAGTEVKIEDEELLIMREDDVLAVVK